MDRFAAMRVFVEVVNGGSFTTASERLGLSRAAVSKSVMQLEEHLGARLLNRTTRRVSLTEVGRAYHQRCREILDAVKAAETVAARATADPRGTLTVNAPHSFGTLHLGPVLAAYCVRYPRVQVALALNDRFIDVVSEGFDVVIRIARLEDSSLVAQRIAPCRIVLCTAPEYLAVHGAPQVPQDLALHACLVYTNTPGGDNWVLSGPDGDETVRVSGPVCADNGEVLKSAALAGLGIAQLPTFIIGPELAAGRLVPVLPSHQPPAITVHAVYPSRRHLSAKVRTFVDFLSAYFGESPSWDGALPA
jgi:DNA-binding transcriptional LysR family regulator